MSPDPLPPPGFLDRLAAERVHRRYYEGEAWKRMTFLGVPVQKWPGDLWNYQEILHALRPSLLVEFGTHRGGSALYFAEVLRAIDDGDARPAGSRAVRVLTVDIDPAACHETVVARGDIERMSCSSTDAAVGARIAALRKAQPGPVFAILDGDHRRDHVRAEMELLRPLLVRGDYLVVEDGNVNGHPVFKAFGPGPIEAIREYVTAHPDDYERDVERETKFSFTFAPEGYLRRR
jgi:cephalosporin hydroxylase